MSKLDKYTLHDFLDWVLRNHEGAKVFFKLTDGDKHKPLSCGMRIWNKLYC